MLIIHILLGNRTPLTALFLHLVFYCMRSNAVICAPPPNKMSFRYQQTLPANPLRLVCYFVFCSFSVLSLRITLFMTCSGQRWWITCIHVIAAILILYSSPPSGLFQYWVLNGDGKTTFVSNNWKLAGSSSVVRYESCDIRRTMDIWNLVFISDSYPITLKFSYIDTPFGKKLVN